MIRALIRKSSRLTKILLRMFVKLHNYSYRKITELASFLNKDIHPKHRITNYHQFFIDRVKVSDTVLDIGCGIGYLAYDVAAKAKKVFGIDISASNIAYAKEHYKRDNLEFIVGDATAYPFKEKFDKVILSNVLEHIKDRVDFLKKIRPIADTILIRVPMENRDWLTVYKKELGLEYRLDATHYIEYSVETVSDEANRAGWEIESYQVNWGEFWGVLRVKP